MLGRRAYPVAGPMTWNSLPDSLLDPALFLPLLRFYTHLTGVRSTLEA